jgi:type III restriction enzyme
MPQTSTVGQVEEIATKRLVVIEDPILNSPFEVPTRHFKFTEEGISNEIVPKRRSSAYFIPVPRPRNSRKGAQLAFDTEWTADRLQENDFINRVRAKVAQWSASNYANSPITSVTRQLLAHWRAQDRERRLFFCQLEAAETAIYLTEVAPKWDSWIENQLRDANMAANPELYRIALKMATGSGKTVLMAMIIAWQALNKFANPQDARFSDSFLVVTPGITIRDRLRVLLPNDTETYYKGLDLVTPEQLVQLEAAKIIVTNFHAFKARELVDASKLTKSILRAKGNGAGLFAETPDQMVRRVCRELGNKKNIVVLNDEAHHCYRRKPDAEEEKLSGDDKKEAQQREEEARIWISGLEAVKRKIGVRAIYDVSATPFFLRGSGYPEGTLFPWVVSDFSLIDAIEAGIVKVPRVPVDDDQMRGNQPTYRDLWLHIRNELPKKSGKKAPVSGEPKLPAVLEGALQSLYTNYRKSYELWAQSEAAKSGDSTPPVFIVVCSNTNVSKLIYEYISGWAKNLPDGIEIPIPGKLELFDNVKDGRWLSRPNTILIDSRQLESGEAMSDDFKKIAAREIDEFKEEYRRRFPGRDVEQLTNEDLLREVMNTVGKRGKLGEQIKCVVSVSMLTEGWDANTVTHILGVRAFGTQLLCEQVVGRGLRRMSYVPVMKDGAERFEAQYAEIYGVPFSFIPCSGSTAEPKPQKIPTRVRALEERIASEITYPRLMGYRYDMPPKILETKFNQDSHMVLSVEDTVPTKTENAPIVGKSSIHTLDDLKSRRVKEVAFLLAKITLEKYFRADSKERTFDLSQHEFVSDVQVWMFPQILALTTRWLTECLTCRDNTFPQMLLILRLAHDATDKIHQAIAGAKQGEKRLMPIPFPYDTVGTTRHVDFSTFRPAWLTRPEKCHISHIAADTGAWEQKVAQSLEDMDEVRAYVKNDRYVGFKIPYTTNGEEKNYEPDFITRVDDGHQQLLNLIIEVSRRADAKEREEAKKVKVATARNFWVPAVNNAGRFGRWAFLEITDPWNVKSEIRSFLSALKG